MKKNIYFLLGLTVFLVLPCTARPPHKGEVLIDAMNYAKLNKKIIVNAEIIFNEVRLDPNEMLTIVPIIRSADEMHVMEFGPIYINGRARDKANMRRVAFGNMSYPENTVAVIKRKNRKSQSFSYSVETEYQKWMRDSELIFLEYRTECGCKDKGGDIWLAGKIHLPAPYIPQFQLSYLVPAVEEVKRRTESYSANFDYAVNRSEIDRNFKNNATVLDQADRIISEAKNDPNIVLDKILITGYASPDGDTAHNISLSEKRAKAFTNYLTGKHNLRGTLITTDWKGEDWQGLSALISRSHDPYCEEILQVIKNTADINKRKTALKNLQGGAVYRKLLETDFPVLRRNSYDIFYTVRGLDTDQSKDLIFVKPQQLSLNEMFMVANSYEKGSKEFKKTFDIAARMYPDDPVACFNRSTSEIETGSYDDAITALQQIETPQGWNNLAVALFRRGDNTQVSCYFEKASKAGLKEAAHNLSEYKKWLESKDN